MLDFRFDVDVGDEANLAVADHALEPVAGAKDHPVAGFDVLAVKLDRAVIDEGARALFEDHADLALVAVLVDRLLSDLQASGGARRWPDVERDQDLLVERLDLFEIGANNSPDDVARVLNVDGAKSMMRGQWVLVLDRLLRR